MNYTKKQVENNLFKANLTKDDLRNLDQFEQNLQFVNMLFDQIKDTYEIAKVKTKRHQFSLEFELFACDTRRSSVSLIADCNGVCFVDNWGVGIDKTHPTIGNKEHQDDVDTWLKLYPKSRWSESNNLMVRIELVKDHPDLPRHIKNVNHTMKWAGFILTLGN
jgi:hypothetical protein